MLVWDHEPGMIFSQECFGHSVACVPHDSALHIILSFLWIDTLFR